MLETKTYIDQMQRTVEIKSTVSRIISLVPSQTELLVDLGLKNQLVGITKFCIHPKTLRKEIPLIGGTKKINREKIAELSPEIIIGNKEENQEEDIRWLMDRFPVWMSDIYTLNDALSMIKSVGELCNISLKANEIISQIEANFNTIQPIEKANVLYLIWKNPFLAAGKNTFIDSLFPLLGLENCIIENRYPEVDFTKIQPDYIFLSSEPFPFKEKHIIELQQLFPFAKIVLVDGEYFSWYGSRLIHAPKYFNELIQSLKTK